MSRPAALAFLGVALLLAVSTALPIAAADHSFAHRYVIYGRLVDAEGNPMPGITLDLSAELFRPDGACRGSTGSDLNTDAYGPTVYDPTTDNFGDFIFCFHAHKLNRVEPGRGTVVIPSMPDVPAITFDFDPRFRSQFVLFQLPSASPEASETAVSSQYTVLGRLWREAEGRTTTVENIEVLGDVLQQKFVEIELLDAQGNRIANTTTISNDYGDFAVRLPTESRFTDGTIRVSALGRNDTQPAAREGISAFMMDYEAEGESNLQTILLVGGGLLGAGLLIGGGYWAINRATERRELENIRGSSTRKRANR